MKKPAKQPPERLNLRLPADLKDQLQAYADEVGVPLNTAALLAIRNFLPFAQAQAKKLRIAKPKAVPQQMDRLTTTHMAKRAEPNPLFRKVGRNELCPCGSGVKAKNCHPAWC